MLENIAPELVWFSIGLFLLLLELAIPLFMVLFFGIGAWVTSLTVLIGIAPGANIQLLIFLGSSVLSLILFRKKGKRLYQGRVSGKTNEVAASENLAGSHGVVVEDIEHQSLSGKVELFGTNWQAVSEVTIKKGMPVEVLSRDNITLRVKPLN